MELKRLAASLAAAQDDVARIFEGYEVPAEYRARLVAYIQRWYLDEGHHEAAGEFIAALSEARAAAGSGLN
jgi:hypothetical protein